MSTSKNCYHQTIWQLYGNAQSTQENELHICTKHKLQSSANIL